MQLTGTHAAPTADSITQLFTKPDYLVQTLGTVFVLRKDPVPCRRWAWHNQMLVALANAGDARSMNTWNKVGRKVKRGAKAIWILTTCTEKSVTGDANGNPVHTTVVTGYRSVPVFAYEDTEGEEIPIHEVNTDWIKHLPLDQALQQVSNKGQKVNQSPVGLSKQLIHAAYETITAQESNPWDKLLVLELGSAVLLNTLDIQFQIDGRKFTHLLGAACKGQKPEFQTCLTIINHTCRSLDLILTTAENISQKTPA